MKKLPLYWKSAALVLLLFFGFLAIAFWYESSRTNQEKQDEKQEERLDVFYAEITKISAQEHEQWNLCKEELRNYNKFLGPQLLPERAQELKEFLSRSAKARKEISQRLNAIELEARGMPLSRSERTHLGVAITAIQASIELQEELSKKFSEQLKR